MRLVKALFPALAAAVMLFSCTTVDKAAMKGLDSVALISVYCDKNIDLSNFSKNTTAIGFINNLANAKEFNLMGQAEALRTQLFTDYASSFPFKLIDEATVLNNEQYKALVAESAKSGLLFRIYTPQGYCAYFINTIGGKIGIKDFAAALPEASGFMMASVSYSLSKKGLEIAGCGNAVIQANLTIKVVDRTGKNVMTVMRSEVSDVKIPYVFGDIIDTTHLQDAANDASVKVRKVMLDFLKKNL